MGSGSGHVEVWEGDGVWHWAWTSGDADEGVVLLGNRTYPTREAAVAAARIAYRGVPIRTPAAPRDHLAARTIVAAALGALGARVVLGLRRRSGPSGPAERGADPLPDGRV